MTIEVHIDWLGETLYLGRLRLSERGATTSFEYDAGWLADPGAFAIDPVSLPLQRGVHHAPSLFGAMQDCGPDRWGRMLIKRSHGKGLISKMPRHEMDYVLALDDESRIGALRFRTEEGGAFLGESSGRLPPVVQLAALMNAADAVHGERETAEDLRFLLGIGSPLGGARPKSAVILRDGQLAIAKFPKPDDTMDIAAGEILAMTLAKKAGITVAGHQLVEVGGKNVAVIERFDRCGVRRTPFLSASSLLALPKEDPGSYTLMADVIRQFGDDVQKDLQEMWRRLAFSLLASNYDDHLRNHAFLMHRAGRWSLSPAYDLNPVPAMDRSAMPKTPISEGIQETSIDAALSAASRFGLSVEEAKKVLREVLQSVTAWREVGKSLGIRASVLGNYESAFENSLVDEARKLLNF
jgi:serine/threonine-protein kinase HipA